jgi:hypothetical protein
MLCLSWVKTTLNYHICVIYMIFIICQWPTQSKLPKLFHSKEVVIRIKHTVITTRPGSQCYVPMQITIPVTDMCRYLHTWSLNDPTIQMSAIRM